MKKLLAILLAGTMILSLSACKGNKAEEAGISKAAGSMETSGKESTEGLTGRLKAIKEAGVLKVATSPDYPPYEFEDITKVGQDKYAGADIELAKYIADKLGVKLQLEPMAFDACMAAVSEGRVDMTLCGMVPKKEREITMDFTDVYYNNGDQVIVILKEDADQYQKLTDFSGKSVAVQNGTIQSDLATEQIPNVTCEPISAIPDGIMMLKTGKVSGIALASLTAENYISNYPELAECGEKFQYTSLGVVAGVVKNEPEFVEELNKIMKDVVDSGIYYQWMEEASELSSQIKETK